VRSRRSRPANAGDTERIKQAVDAMKTSHSWKILREMGPEGGYPEFVSEYADAIAKNQPANYRQGLGC
jgi:hypothetical protein